MKTSYGEVSVDYLDFNDVEVRIANRSDALALRDAIEREII